MATHYDTVHLTEVASTQDEASGRFDRSGTPTLVVADRQVAGRGRQGRSWEQADRAMFASYTHPTTWPEGSRSLIPLACGLAMREAIAHVAKVDILLKWPNDLMRQDEKVGGILVEASDARITSGCGVNLWWRSPPSGAATIYADDPGSEVARELAGVWVERLRERLARGPEDWGRGDYIAASATLGKGIAWDAGEGVAIDLAPDGALVVETRNGRVTIRAGDIHTRL